MVEVVDQARSSCGRISRSKRVGDCGVDRRFMGDGASVLPSTDLVLHRRTTGIGVPPYRPVRREPNDSR